MYVMWHVCVCACVCLYAQDTISSNFCARAHVAYTTQYEMRAPGLQPAQPSALQLQGVQTPADAAQWPLVRDTRRHFHTKKQKHTEQTQVFE